MILSSSFAVVYLHSVKFLNLDKKANTSQLGHGHILQP